MSDCTCDNPVGRSGHPAHGRYCLRVCYCGRCEHYQPIPRSTEPIIVKARPKKEPSAWDTREEPTWLDDM